MTVLRGATLIDGTGAAPVRDATLVIQDGRIESITSGAGVLADASRIRLVLKDGVVAARR
jgi:N-acyl-D-aspartate/D-glutamate deacylase